MIQHIIAFRRFSRFYFTVNTIHYSMKVYNLFETAQLQEYLRICFLFVSSLSFPYHEKFSQPFDLMLDYERIFSREQYFNILKNSGQTPENVPFACRKKRILTCLRPIRKKNKQRYREINCQKKKETKR